MTIVVLLILVLVWAVVLGPSLLRRGVQRRSADSIGAFHRQLRVLQRAGPALVDPVHRLDTTVPTSNLARHPVGTSRAGLIVVRPDAAVSSASSRQRPSASGSRARRADPFFSPSACKRRRDVLVALSMVTIVTGLVGAVPGARPMLAFAGLALVALLCYLVLLVRMRNHALERELKLRYLPDPHDREASVNARRVAAR